MKTSRWKTKSESAFTLVELLVVIAIIGVLASLVLPRVADAMFSARVMEASVRAKNIVQSIFQRDVGSVHLSRAEVWPKSGGFNISTWTFNNSTEYFRELVTNGTLSVNFQFFALGGVGAAGSVTEFQPENNAFCIVASITDAYPETAPAVFTRNLRINKMDDSISGTGGIVALDDGMRPFGAKGFAFANRGASARGLSLVEELQMRNFTNLFTATTGTRGLTNTVLRPGANF